MMPLSLTRISSSEINLSQKNFFFCEVSKNPSRNTLVETTTFSIPSPKTWVAPGLVSLCLLSFGMRLGAALTTGESLSGLLTLTAVYLMIANVAAFLAFIAHLFFQERKGLLQAICVLGIISATIAPWM